MQRGWPSDWLAPESSQANLGSDSSHVPVSEKKKERKSGRKEKGSQMKK
jgi:hypothetical protein